MHILHFMALEAMHRASTHNTFDGKHTRAPRLYDACAHGAVGA